ncbi:hypothetical protein AA18895_0189 [Acetobacter ghanensis DSM 18895]|nr:hypothetical protein AA18895_0189 [Acetobacter ghanensis DSM 18895]
MGKFKAEGEAVRCDNDRSRRGRSLKQGPANGQRGWQGFVTGKSNRTTGNNTP